LIYSFLLITDDELLPVFELPLLILLLTGGETLVGGGVLLILLLLLGLGTL
jgi:hypothetical protein